MQFEIQNGSPGYFLQYPDGFKREDVDPPAVGWFEKQPDAESEAQRLAEITGKGFLIVCVVSKCMPWHCAGYKSPMQSQTQANHRIVQENHRMPLMYHVASSEHRDSIAANGLLASRDSTGFGAVFLADSLPKDCLGFDIWVVDVDGLDLEDDHTGEPEHGSWWMHFGDIQPERLSIHGANMTPTFSPSIF